MTDFEIIEKTLHGAASSMSLPSKAVIEAYLFLARKIYKPDRKTPAKSVKRIFAPTQTPILSRSSQDISPQNQATVQMSYQPQAMIINTSQTIAQQQILQISTLPNLNPTQQNFLNVPRQVK